MDIISFNEAATANGRIEIINANPDSTSGIVTVPKTIASGETVTVPAGRVAVLPNVVVEGDLVVEAGGEIFVPAGANFSDLEGQIALKADTSYVNGKYSGFKNYIINGNFDVWQRGTSFSGLTNGSYSVDRWVVYDTVNDINYNVIRNTGVFQGGYGAAYTWNSGTGGRSIMQFIENVTKFKVGTQVTISFEAYTDSTPYTIDVAIQGVKGVWTASTTESVSNITLTNIKTRYSVTLTVPDWTTLGIDYAHLEDTKLACKFTLPHTTNGKNFIISKVQLEEGSVATPFEQRPYGLELSLCQRYYEKILTSIRAYADGGSFYWAIPMKVNKRNTPTIIQGTSFSGQNVSASTGAMGISQENITYRIMPVATGFCTMDNLSLEIISEL